MKLIDRYGIEFVKKGKNRYYSPDLKQEMIDKVLLEGRSQISVSRLCSPKSRNAFKLAGNTRKMGILLLRKQEGDQLKWDVNGRKLGKK